MKPSSKTRSKISSLFSNFLPATILLCTSSAIANTNNENFTVAVIQDAVGSENLIAGNYHQGLTDLSSKVSSDRFARLMGYCVAHIKTYKLAAAESSCTSAISALSSNAARGRKGKELKALAYSNRGIARFLNDDNLSAYEDFSTAKALSSNKIVIDNIRYFKKAIRVIDSPDNSVESLAD
ncbi:hypothetical protein tinsulaeT_27710 [Thalassotalea insulae]|uniref:Uncharacterized protein n=1 Tax=Thalassotalea insulae TaxID=2056778 RepID=A0ABQ6GYY9_9GAMM|nr:hypothetical protein [Thalassotalea insulae]GLX79431.1 hypothetical protein tinsulaeT_27710 [Thalassotalea insulae]